MLRKLGLAALVAACGPWSTSQAGVYVGVGLGGPAYYRPYGCHHHRYGWGYGGYYRPYGVGVVVAPPPIVVQQPAVIQQPIVVQPAYAPPAVSTPAPAPTPLPPPTPTTAAAAIAPDVMPAVAVGARTDLEATLEQLRSGAERVRADAAVRLGRLRLERAVGPLVKALNSDGSPVVREAAARGLGLIGSPSALSALQYAAQSDDDREVRHSASFAAETIRGSR